MKLTSFFRAVRKGIFPSILRHLQPSSAYSTTLRITIGESETVSLI